MKLWMSTICLAVALLVGMTAGVSLAKEKPRSAKSVDAESVDAESVSNESSRDNLTYAPDTLPEAPDVAALLRRLVIGTAIVLGLCVCTMLAGRRWLTGVPTRASSGSRLRLVETISLGNRSTIHLIQSGEHQILVGVDGSGIKSLVPLPQSFERAIADAGSPDYEEAETFAGSAPGNP